MYNFPNNFKYLRKKAGLTQTALGNEIGLQKASISAYELGERSPSFKGILAIANFFDVSLDELIYGDLTDDMAVNENTPTKSEVTSKIE